MWPTESPWLLTVPLACLAVILASRAANRSSLRGAMLAGATAMLAGIPILIDWLVVTDREQVAANVEGVVRAFEAGDADRTLAYFDEAAVGERAMATIALRLVTVEDPLSLKDISVAPLDERAIEATFRVNGTVLVRGSSVGHQATMWSTIWQKSGDQWRIARVQQRDPLTGEPLNQLSQLR